MMRKKKTGNGGKERSAFWKSLRVVENNTLLLILSFLCAVVVWFSMMGTELAGRGSMVSNVPVEIELSEAAREAGVRIFDRSHTSANVSVTGNSMVTSKLTTEDIGVSASLDPSLSMLTGSSMQEATLTLRAYKKGNTLADYEIESVSPAEVTVVYDKYKEMILTLEDKIQYKAAEGYYASSAPTLSVDMVTISGPESEVSRVASAALAYTFSDALTQSKMISCKVTLYDVNGEIIDPTEHYITLNEDTVDVSIAVTSRKTITILPNIQNIPEGFSKQRITIDPETIEVAGDGEVLAKYSELTLSQTINFLDVTPENNTFRLPIQVPVGVTNISNAEYATVTINLNGYAQTNLITENITVINVPEGKTAALTNKAFRITIVGTAAQIAKLTGESISCTVDLAAVADPNGSIQVPVKITINGADSCWATGVYTAHVTITEEEDSSEPLV